MSRYKSEDTPELFNVAGNDYYFDLEELSRFIRIDKSESVHDILREVEKETEPTNDTEDDESVYSQMIDVTKWETTKVMIESVLSENNPVDEAMGYSQLSKQLSIPFKLSFNTLLKYKIIKEENGR